MRKFPLVTLTLCLFVSPSFAADLLISGGKLGSTETLTSPNSRFALVMQADGNLVLHHDSTVLWCTETSGVEGASCQMQADGNLVVYGTRDGIFSAVWSSETAGNAGARFCCQDDGNVVI